MPPLSESTLFTLPYFSGFVGDTPHSNNLQATFNSLVKGVEDNQNLIREAVDFDYVQEVYAEEYCKHFEEFLGQKLKYYGNSYFNGIEVSISFDALTALHKGVNKNLLKKHLGCGYTGLLEEFSEKFTYNGHVLNALCKAHIQTHYPEWHNYNALDRQIAENMSCQGFVDMAFTLGISSIGLAYLSLLREVKNRKKGKTNAQ